MENYKIVNPKSGRSRLYGRLSHTVAQLYILLPTKQTYITCMFQSCPYSTTLDGHHSVILGKGAGDREVHSLPHLGVYIFVVLSLF